MAEERNFCLEELAFRQLGEVLELLKSVEDCLDVFDVLLRRRREDEYVVDVDDRKRQVPKHPIHGRHEYRRGVCQPKGDDPILEMSKRCPKRRANDVVVR